MSIDHSFSFKRSFNAKIFLIINWNLPFYDYTKEFAKRFIIVYNGWKIIIKIRKVYNTNSTDNLVLQFHLSFWKDRFQGKLCCFKEGRRPASLTFSANKYENVKTLQFYSYFQFKNIQDWIKFLDRSYAHHNFCASSCMNKFLSFFISPSLLSKKLSSVFQARKVCRVHNSKGVVMIILKIVFVFMVL